MSKENLEPYLFDKLTLGLVKSLEKRYGICDVNLEQKPSVVKTTLDAWEQKHSCVLPDDVKSFYMTNNGVKLTWSVKMNDTRIPVGSLEIHPLEHAVRIVGASGGGNVSHGGGFGLHDLQTESEEEDDDDWERPHFDKRSRIFEVDPCDGFSKVCLVYTNTKPGVPASCPSVWLLDRALEWHFLVPDFLSYYRMSLLHMGLPQWQYTFTKMGTSPAAKQWFHLYAPMRLDTLLSECSLDDDDKPDNANNSLDINRVFKGKADKKKVLGAVNTKKKPAPLPANKLTNTTSRTSVAAGAQTAKVVKQ